MCRKQNFKIVFGFKSDTAVLTFTFRFLSPRLFSRSSCLICFSLAGHLVGFILVGKAFRILGLDERKGRWVVEQDFHGNFQVNVTWFFAFFSGVLDWIVLILVWFERSLHSAQVSRQSYPWQSKLMTSQAVERTWIHMGVYGGLRGEWVNNYHYVTRQYSWVVSASSGQHVEIPVRGSWVQVPLWQLAGFVLCCQEFKTLATLVHRQLVASYQLGFLTLSCSIWITNNWVECQ